MNAFLRATLLLLGLCVPLQFPRGAEGKYDKKTPAGTVKNVGTAEFDKLRSAKNAVVLDVRTPKEFAAGHIPGATNVDWYAPDFAEKVSRLPKDKTYLVHCAGGVRSAKACDKMSALSFRTLYNLEGGFKAWEKDGKPVER